VNTNTSIALGGAGVIGLMCLVVGIAMIYEPAALIALGIAVLGVSLALAYTRGSA